MLYSNNSPGGLIALALLADYPGLFVVQPSEQQWRNLASKLDRSLVLASQPISEIIVSWYTKMTTGRVAGIRMAPTTMTLENDKAWERAV